MSDMLKKSDFPSSAKVVVWPWICLWLCLLPATHQLNKLTQEQNLFTEDFLKQVLLSFYFFPYLFHISHTAESKYKK